MTSPVHPTSTQRAQPELLMPQALLSRTATTLAAKFEGVFSVQTVERYVFESYTALHRTAKVHTQHHSPSHHNPPPHPGERQANTSLPRQRNGEAPVKVCSPQEMSIGTRVAAGGYVSIALLAVGEEMLVRWIFGWVGWPSSSGSGEPYRVGQGRHRAELGGRTRRGAAAGRAVGPGMAHLGPDVRGRLGGCRPVHLAHPIGG